MSEPTAVRDLLELAIGGGWGSETQSSDSIAVGVIRGADFPAVAVGDWTELPVRYEGRDRVYARTLRDGDIVLEISGGTKDRPTGRTVYVSKEMLSRSTVPTIPASFCRLVRVDPAKAVPRFVYYWLQAMYSAGRTWSYQNISTGISNFQFEYFLDAERIALPTRSEQHAVADALGSLDEAIAANRRLTKVLEDRIRVRFEELEAADDGWPRMPIGDAVSVRGGGTPSTKESRFWVGGTHAWVTPRDLSRLSAPCLLGTERMVTDEGLSRVSSGLLPVGTVLLSSRAPIGYLAITEVPVAVNQGFIAMVCDGSLPNYYIWQWALANMGSIEARANGSTFQEISKANFRPISVAVPPEQQVKDYADFVEPLYRLIVEKVRESEVLVQLRDTLLQPLISGELRLQPAGTDERQEEA